MPRIYLAERKDPASNADKYVYCHEPHSGEDGIFPHECVSMEYLCGYADGATTLRWNELGVRNGMPEEYCSNWQFELIPLTKKSLEELLAGTSLRLHYPELVE